MELRVVKVRHSEYSNVRGGYFEVGRRTVSVRGEVDMKIKVGACEEIGDLGIPSHYLRICSFRTPRKYSTKRFKVNPQLVTHYAE